jgi:hypothetical protein
MKLVRIRVRIDSPHCLVYQNRQLNGVVLRRRPGKSEVICHSRWGTIKTHPCSKAQSDENRLKFSSPSPVIVTSVKNSWAGRETLNNQSICFMTKNICNNEILMDFAKILLHAQKKKTIDLQYLYMACEMLLYWKYCDVYSKSCDVYLINILWCMLYNLLMYILN